MDITELENCIMKVFDAISTHRCLTGTWVCLINFGNFSHPNGPY